MHDLEAADSTRDTSRPRSRQEPMEAKVQGGGKVAASKTATPAELEALLVRQGYRCALSGVLLTPQQAALDHRWPVAKGGTHSVDNLQWLDPVINKAKHTLTNEEFVEMCRRVVAYAS
jgi:5-methylcytosine-specific restriction endonuclease McrA